MRIGAEEGVRGRNPIRVPSRRVIGDTNTNETETWGSIHVPVISAPISKRGKCATCFQKSLKGTQATQRFCSFKNIKDGDEDKNTTLKKSLLLLML